MSTAAEGVYIVRPLSDLGPTDFNQSGGFYSIFYLYAELSQAAEIA